jgi:hypothetical protein
MPQKTNLNVAPYYDDFNPKNNFYKVLFRPGYSIQTRELTTLQSTLQNQIENFGKYQFKQGDLVVPGEVGLNTRLDYVKLSSVSEVAVNVNGEIVFQKYDINKLIGQQLQGITSGVVANVLAAEYGNDREADTIYVKYINSGNSGEEQTFRQGETLEVIDGINTPLLVVGTDGSVLPTSIEVIDPDTKESSFIESFAMGYSSAVKVEEGIYFANGYFVRNEEQLLIIDKYYDKPSALVGFDIKEEIITPEENSSLYDNSRGFSNSTAPGAHRLKISLELKKYDYDASTDKNFIQLLTIKSGIIQRQIKPVDYNLIEDTLARRTYDESGDYVVNDFPLEVREYYQQNGNYGIYAEDRNNLVNGLSKLEASKKLVASVGVGKAYVKGYEIVNNETKYLEIDKARDTISRDNITLKTKGLAEFKVTNVFGSVPLNDEGSDVTSYPTIFLNSVFNDGSIGLNGTNISTDTYKKTLERRGQKFEVGYGIKTIYILVTNTTTPLAVINDSNFEDILGTIWFIKSRVGELPATIDFVNSISYSKVKRTEYSDQTVLLELTVYGRKDLLDLFLKEYDEEGSSKLRKIFLTQADAFADTDQFGYIVDYNNIITPVIGVAKPKNFSFVDRSQGFNPDLDIVLSKGKLSDGTPSYGATFNLNYFNPVFFTRLLLDSTLPESNINSEKFTPGMYITGLKSSAYGVIEGSSTEPYSYGNTMFVKTLSGQFLPGESILDEKGNILRIANENTISHFIVIKRGAGYINPVININGVSFDDSKIKIFADGSSIYRVSILDRDAISTQYSQPPTVTLSTIAAPAAEAEIIPVLYKNTVLTYSPQNVKFLYAEYGSGGNNKFTADIEINKPQFSETKTVTEFTFSGVEGTKYLECNGFGGDAFKELVQGDLILFVDDQGITNRTIVQYATSPEGPRKSRIYLDVSLQNNVTNASVVRLRPIVDNLNTSLLFPTGSNQVSSLIKDTEDSKFKYYVRRDFVTTGSSSGGSITFAAQLAFGTQRFANPTEQNFLVTVIDKGNSPLVNNGDILYIDRSYINVQTSTDSTSGLTAGSVTITLPNNYFGNISTNFPKLKLSATIEVTKAKPRLKTAIRNKRIVVLSGGDRVVPLRGQDYDSEEVEIFSYSDVYKLRYIYEGSSTNPPNVDTNGNLISGTDVTNRFTFDDGQRDTYYDVSRIVLKPGFEAPVGQLVIGFDYFEHSQGDFCTVDSYLHEAGVGQDEIPSFNSSVYGLVSLRDVVDFRPKSDSNTTISGFQQKSILSQPDYIKFNGTGGVVSGTPASDNNLEYTVSFSESQYLDRIDGIFLDKKGEFIVKKGNSSLNPSKPEIIDDSIALYYLYVPAFTKSSKDVRVVPVDNKRYTMRDIGKLEKRIERLEYYTTLSILEQQALNMQIKNEIGIDRFKSGFVVDNFETHIVGNLSSLDYKCSVDTQQSVLRSQVKEDSFNLEEVYTRQDERDNAGYQKTNDVITLPYTNLKLLGNNFATKTINPNPFVVLQYVGDAQINPPVDQWYETNIAPLISDNNTSLYSIYLAKSDVRDASSAFYNSFIINWVGSNRSFYNIGSFSDINTDIASSTVKLASIGSSSNISPLNNETAKGVATKTINGNSVVSSLQFFARSIPIKFKLTRLKPKTQLHVFLDGIRIDRWIIPDIKFTGVPSNSLSAFNLPLTTDENGNASGILLLPAGKPPRENTPWTGDPKTVIYDQTAQDVFVTTGVKTIRFTSSITDESKDKVDTYTEVKYYATGSLPENPASIVSTLPAIFKANEGIQLVDQSTSSSEKPNPLSQTFNVQNFDGGVFVTGVDLYFSKKSNNIPVRVYITNVDVGKPGKYIIPGSESVVFPNTYLKVFASGNLSVFVGEDARGRSSGASGPILKVLDKNDIEVLPSNTGEITLNNEQVYTLVLSNNNGTPFIQNETLEIPSLTVFNNRTAQNLTLTIAKDSGKIVDLKIKNVGLNYRSATITIESPQLPGGSTATGTVDVSNGRIYNAEISLGGSGYTDPPSIVVRGVGTGAAGAVIESVIEIDTPAIIMGVATDREGSTPSITPTRFNFEHPVYLQNDSEYSLSIETDSTEYELWGSRLTETEVATGISVTAQPLLGSLYKSQNTDNWTEDIFEDVKFTLYRAEFDITRPANVLLTNKSLGYEFAEIDPVETYALANANATSPLFKNNNSVIKIRHRDNGFETSGKSHVFFKRLRNVGGFNANVLNSTLFRVSNVGVDYYNIIGPNRASSNSIGGGNSALISYNRKYERLFAHVNYLQAPNTKIDSFVRTTNIVPVDSNTLNYTSYSQTNYEKTFLNEEHFFLNQKVISSRINEILNNISQSLIYKLELSSNVSYLSPVIDLRVASVKTSTNRIENASGKEDRFGKRYQILKFLPLYKINVTGNGAIPIEINQTVQGTTSGARGKIVKSENNSIWVKVTSPSTFIPAEYLFFSTQSQAGGNLEESEVFVQNGGVLPQSFSFEIGSTIVAFNPSDVNQKYSNKISGKIINWDSAAKELTVENDKAPINNDYVSRITLGSAFSRNPTINGQSPDIFRIGDLIYYDDIQNGEEQFVEVGAMEFSTGVDFVSENSSKNSSSLAKYVTKEISINQPGTSIDVRLTLNVKDIENVKVLYRIKESSSQINFDDIEWQYFNADGNPNNDDLATYNNVISGQIESQSAYQELKYSVSNLSEFNSFAVKVIMKTDDPAYPPKIQDLRAVASY